MLYGDLRAEEVYIGVCSVTTGYNISVTAMSHMLGSDPRIGRSAHSGILSAVTRRNCSPGTFTHNLKLKSVKLIKILYASLQSPFCTRTINRITRCLDRRNEGVLLHYANSALRKGRGKLRCVMGHRISTIMLVNSPFYRARSGTRVTTTTRDVPVVAVGDFLRLPDICYVATSRGKNVYRLMRRLVDHRQHHVLFLCSGLACDYGHGVRNCGRTCTGCKLPMSSRLVIRMRNGLRTVGAYVGRLLMGKNSFSTIINTGSVLTINARGTLRHVNLGLPVVNFSGSVLTHYTAPRLDSVSGRLSQLYTATVTIVSSLLDNGRTRDRAVVRAHLMRQSAFHSG